MAGNNKRRKAWLAQMGRLWPAIKGSLAQVRKPCIRKNCTACASGRKHSAWLLSAVVAGRRTTLYVPQALAGDVQRAINNGRKLEALLQKAAIQLIKTHRSTSHKPTPKS